MLKHDAETGDGKQAQKRTVTRKPRQEAVGLLEEYRERLGNGESQKGVAEACGIPRSTLQHWNKRRDAIDAEPELVAFFESGVGLAFLHRLMIALHLVFTLVGPASTRMICLFLELSRLDAFVASSHGSQEKVCTEINQGIVAFEEQHLPALTAQMDPKRITVCPDETFHPGICLVAIEPVSNFILVEEYAAKRDAAAWSEAMGRGLDGLPVEVIQSTSDEGKGLLSYTRKELNAHHSPDLFHIQQDLTRAMSAPLAAQVAQAEKAVAQARAEVDRLRLRQQQWAQTDHGPGRPPNFDKRIAKAEQRQRKAEQTLEVTRKRQEEARTLNRKIGRAYHPFDLTTGELRSGSEIVKDLTDLFDQAKLIAAEAGLSDHSKRKIAKARRLLPAIGDTLAFFERESRRLVAALGLAASEERYVLEQLVAAAYLSRVASKAGDAETRERLRQKAAELLGRLPSEPLSAFVAEALRRSDKVNRVVQECADLFQRSSSCVEGRNGQLSLRHHSFHRLTADKLRALTVVHNFFIQRPDGTTPAERFFECKPPDLFKWLLDRLDVPARPARKRPGREAASCMPRAA